MVRAADVSLSMGKQHLQKPACMSPSPLWDQDLWDHPGPPCWDIQHPAPLATQNHSHKVAGAAGSLIHTVWVLLSWLGLS